MTAFLSDETQILFQVPPATVFKKGIINVGLATTTVYVCEWKTNTATLLP